MFAALSSGAADWADPRVPELLAWLRAGERRSELQGLLRSEAGALRTLTAAHARPLLELLGGWGMLEAARLVSSLPQLRRDPDVAAQRARLSMQARDYHAAIEASDVAISALLQPGLSIEEFLRLCVAGAPAEGLLRFERQVLGSRVHLSERLALRWEALHRAGMSHEASEMQLMCQRYFPERASVWATAGNHALDADDLSGAEAYFQRCLQLDAQWTAGLAGLAIVCERRKDWAAALPYRRRVLEVEHALERDDAASLQRRLRYAAALARLDRWREAEPLFRAAVHASALAQLPAEQPVLLRVFSQDLYAPALVAALSGGPSAIAAHAQHTDVAEPATSAAQDRRAFSERSTSAARADVEQPAVSLAPRAVSGPSASAARADVEQPAVSLAPRAVSGPSASAARADVEEPAVSLARHEAALIGQLAFAVRELASDASEPRWALALCAYLAGEHERAYELLDRVEVDRPDDVALHFLLWRSASAIGHPETASIRGFAEQAARAALAAPGTQSELQQSYAAALLPHKQAQLDPQRAAAPHAREQQLATAEQARLDPQQAAAGSAHSEPRLGTRERAQRDTPLVAASVAHSEPRLADVLAPEELERMHRPVLRQLELIVAFRALREAAGESPLAAAAASTFALAALVAAVTSR